MKKEKAKTYAHAAHDSIGQKRKYSGVPYWVHTDAVAETVASVTTDEDMICAAHLHDVIEDVFPENPLFNRQGIQNQFGKRVLLMVEELTSEFTKERYPHLNRVERKRLECERLAGISSYGQTIKYADIMDNVADIANLDPDFARRYLVEKRASIQVMDLGTRVLRDAAAKLINGAFKQIPGCSTPGCGYPDGKPCINCGLVVPLRPS